MRLLSKHSIYPFRLAQFWQVNRCAGCKKSIFSLWKASNRPSGRSPRDEGDAILLLFSYFKVSLIFQRVDIGRTLIKKKKINAAKWWNMFFFLNLNKCVYLPNCLFFLPICFSINLFLSRENNFIRSDFPHLEMLHAVPGFLSLQVSASVLEAHTHVLSPPPPLALVRARLT